MKIAPAGDRAVLVDLGDVSAAELHGYAAAARARRGVVACIVGQSSLYVVFAGSPNLDVDFGAPVSPPALLPSAAPVRTPALQKLRVSFRDEVGPDLREFLEAKRVSLDEFFGRLKTLDLVVRYVGFRGGFGYLDGWPEEWAMPRRPTSRRRVEAGTFGIAGAVAGFYPIASPGGWNLLGRTGERLAHALAPGDRIVIEPTMDVIDETEAPVMTPALQAFPCDVLDSPLAQVVGAMDWSGIERGVPPGGPFDDVAAAAANRAVGNAPDAPLLECALSGPHIVARRDVACAWVSGGESRLFELRRGEETRIGRITGGLRGYLAAGEARGHLVPLEREDRLTIGAIAGPHESDIRELVCDVTPQLDRVGIRMRAVEPAGLSAAGLLPSCGMQCGTIQLHPDGSVVGMGPDHPVTGGYLQPMTVISSERWKLAQLAPGERVRFVAQLP